MKFQLALSALFVIAIQMISAKLKGFEGPKIGSPKKGTFQVANLNNNVNSNANSVAVNAGLFGNANSLSSAEGTNFNMVGQCA